MAGPVKDVRRRPDGRPATAWTRPGGALMILLRLGSPPSLRALQREHRACHRCVDAGFITRAHPVFSGHAGQRILLVGQAPGPVETDQTRPFAGRAGRVLMRWMITAGFDDESDVRQRVYMTAMTTC